MIKSRQKIIDDGREAKRLLDDTDLQRFLDEIRADCYQEFEMTDFGDKDGREAAFMKWRGVETVRQALRALVDNAAIEKKGK